MRKKAALSLKRFPEERAWSVLEKALLSETEEDHILQRQCLFALGESLPLDRMRKLLLDPRVYRNPYFGVRTDVATALAALNVREGIALDILCDYLVDEDPQDRDHAVRQDAWLSLWVFSGIAYGIEEQDLFRFPPRPFVDLEQAREFLFRHAQMRPGITVQQASAVKKMVADLAQMQKVRHTFSQTLKTQILAKWREEAEKAAPKPAEPQEPPKAPPAEVPPEAPPQQPQGNGPEKGSGDEKPGAK
jgi:hypothetical protein